MTSQKHQNVCSNLIITINIFLGRFSRDPFPQWFINVASTLYQSSIDVVSVAVGWRGLCLGGCLVWLKLGRIESG